MRDWRTELDELLATSTAFAASIRSERSRIRGAPVDTWACSEREEIKKRVASFKAHQQRLIVSALRSAYGGRVDVLRNRQGIRSSIRP